MKQYKPISLLHMRRLFGEYGIYQHATFLDPLLSEGYCVDDNARAVLVLLRGMPFFTADDRLFAENALAVCWKFLIDAQRDNGAMYNFRTSKGVWLIHDVSGDMYARVLRACIAIIVQDSDVHRIEQARTLIQKVLLNADDIYIAPRACAETLIALRDLSIHEKLSQPMTDIAQKCSNKLVAEWNRSASKDWPWFEDVMAYANAILPHGLLAALQMNQEKHLEPIVRRSSDFLIATTIKDEMFIPIGNSSWYHPGGKPSLYDQQPIEAGTMMDFFADLYEWDKEIISEKNFILPYTWFFGNNTSQLPMANQSTGACYDGLHDGAVNENCGAESLLAYLWAEVRIREVGQSPE